MILSISSRFFYSLAANLIKAILGFFSGIIVARGLGPDQYGNMVFLLSSFIALRQLLDMGSSTAFFTLLSQAPRSRRFVLWYAVWLGVQFFIPLITVGLLFPIEWIELIWKSEQRSIVILAFVATYMQMTAWTAVMQIAESQRQTHLAQKISSIVMLFHLFFISFLWWQKFLGVSVILISIAIEWMIATCLLLKFVQFNSNLSESDSFGLVFKEFKNYCKYLIPYSWLSFVYEFFDRWLLQTFGGNVQQAYFSVALQFSAIVMIGTSSILNIFWKEIAEAYRLENHERVEIIYQRVSRGLFFVASLTAGLLLPWSVEMIRLSLGSAYVEGASVLGIMLVYPIHQSLGQLGGAMLYATGRVRAQVVFGMLNMGLSIIVTYFVLAPVDAPISGFNLGSVGLAIKMVVLQVISVNAVIIYLAKVHRIALDWAYQPICILLCFSSGLLAHAIVHNFNFILDQFWLGLLVSAFFHVLIIITILWLNPSLAGLNRDDLINTISAFSGINLNNGIR